MDNSGRPPFDKNHVYESLRRPHNIQQQQQQQLQLQQQMAAVASAARGALSVNAPEFVPQKYSFANHSQHHHHPSQQQQQQPNQFGSHQQHHHNVSNMMGSLSMQERKGHQSQPQSHHHYHQSQQQPLQQQQQQHHHHQQQQQQHQQHNHRGGGGGNHFQGGHQHYRGGNGGGGGGGGNKSFSIQNRLNFNSNNQQQYKSAGNSETSQNGRTNNSAQSEEETFALNFIESIIIYLIDDPGNYDELSSRVVNVFEKFGNNEFVLSNSMEIIFKRSIEEQNFRYMGAKLYGLLDMLDLREDSTFRTLLNLKLTFHREELLVYMQNEQAKVRGTTFFLAELYMQLRNDGSRLKDIASNIIFAINQLLLKTTPENVKCICLALKLSGYDLEFDFPHEMTQIIAKLEDTMNTLDVSTSRVLENVLNLQKNKWGRKTETPESLALQKSQEIIRTSDEPVFYGPDGQILTEEESSFLTSNIPRDGCDNFDANGDDDSDIELDPEMDEETEKAFKDFLKSNNQRSNNC